MSKLQILSGIIKKKPGPKNTVLSRISISKLNKLFHSKITLVKLAKKLKCSSKSIKNKLKRAGVYKQKAPQTLIVSLNKRKYGRLKVLSLAHEKPVTWKCKCSCGNLCYIPTGNLTSNNTKSCGCIKAKLGKKSAQYKGYGNVSGVQIYRIKYNAKIRGIDFNIDAKYLWNLFLKQKGKCLISGIKIKLCDSRFNYLKEKGQTASLDRKNSKKGYIKGNVQWVHKSINTMKWNFSTNKFIKFCKMVAENNE